MVSILVMMQCNLAGFKINLHIAGIKSCRLPFCIVAIPLLSKALTVFVPAWNKQTLGGFRTMTLRSLTHQNRSNRWRSSKAKVSSLFVALTKLTIEFYRCLLQKILKRPEILTWILLKDLTQLEDALVDAENAGIGNAVFPWLSWKCVRCSLGVSILHMPSLLCMQYYAVNGCKWIDMIRYVYIYINI